MVTFSSASEVVRYLDGLAASLNRKPRVYVIGYKERPREEAQQLIASCDVCTSMEAWKLLDDTSRYEWINK